MQYTTHLNFTIFALTGVAQLVGRCPAKRKVTGLILVKAFAWVAGLVPSGGTCER